MAKVEMSVEEYHELLRMIGEVKESEGAHEEAVVMKKKKKMKKSPYRKELTKQQKIVEKKHPRMSFSAKSTEAHRLTRKKLGIRKKRS
tara:strand:- start:1311 stop:1574 length:264 start_codon:yes stop_codon:yes gene_type:complete